MRYKFHWGIWGHKFCLFRSPRRVFRPRQRTPNRSPVWLLRMRDWTLSQHCTMQCGSECNDSYSHQIGCEGVSKQMSTVERAIKVSSVEQANEQAVWENKKTNERVAQYFCHDSWLFWTIVLCHYMENAFIANRRQTLAKSAQNTEESQVC